MTNREIYHISLHDKEFQIRTFPVLETGWEEYKCEPLLDGRTIIPVEEFGEIVIDKETKMPLFVYFIDITHLEIIKSLFLMKVRTLNTDPDLLADPNPSLAELKKTYKTIYINE